MEIHQLTPALSVSPQLSIADIEKVAKAGFKTIICNRPDLEGIDQPSSEQIKASCTAVGIDWQYLPVNPRDYTDQQALAFGQLLDQAKGPVLAYCRTGTRSTNLWALSQAGKNEVADIVSLAKNASYDLSKLAERIGALAAELAAK